MKLALNEPFPLSLPSEGLFFEWRSSSAPLLIMNIHEPRSSEIAGLKARSEFALAYVNELIFVLVRAANNALPWSDAPFSVRLYEDSERPNIIKEISDETRLTVTFVVVDAKDSRVKLLKQCSFSPTFSQELYRLVALQRKSDLKDWSYDIALQSVYSQYDATQLVDRAVARCFAGD